MITDQDADDDIKLFLPMHVSFSRRKQEIKKRKKKREMRKKERKKERKNHTSGDLVPPSVSNASDASPAPSSPAYSNDMTEFHTGRAD